MRHPEWRQIHLHWRCVRRLVQCEWMVWTEDEHGILGCRLPARLRPVRIDLERLDASFRQEGHEA